MRTTAAISSTVSAARAAAYHLPVPSGMTVFAFLCWSVPTLGSSAAGVGTGLGVCGDGVLCDDGEGGREEGEGLQDGVGVGSSATEKQRKWCKKIGANVISFSYTISTNIPLLYPCPVRVKSAKVSGSFPVFAKWSQKHFL
jgi:hypothetical protein